MCGRMTHQFKWKTIHALLSLNQVTDDDRGWLSFNVAPTQLIPVVRTSADGEREIVEMRWGMIPSWADDRKIGSHLINARAETVNVKPAFRQAFKQRRCVILASGFYEWRRAPAPAPDPDPGSGRSHPFHFRRRDGQPLLMAGLWDSWTDRESGELVESCTIITTAASADVRPVHDRMPAIVEPAGALVWLNPRPPVAPPDELLALLQPAADRTLESHPVSPKVNSPKNNDASLVEPVPAA